MPEPAPLTLEQIADLAGRALGKIDLWGAHGATMVSLDELIAMATALAILGVRPIPPGTPAPAAIDPAPSPLKGTADV